VFSFLAAEVVEDCLFFTGGGGGDDDDDFVVDLIEGVAFNIAFFSAAADEPFDVLRLVLPPFFVAFLFVAVLLCRLTVFFDNGGSDDDDD
jgi:hypothetical protein